MAKKASGKPARALARAVKTMARVARRAAKPAASPARKSAPKAARAASGKGGKYVYFFGNGKADGDRSMRDTLGGKGANLAEMTSVLELPVPPGFTISTDACRAYMAGGWPDGLTKEVDRALDKLEKAMGKHLGDPGDPLLVSVRSGAKFSMPGMMDTVLNLGLNDESVEGLAKQTSDERFAYDSYRRFIQMYGRIVLGLPGEEFDRLFDAAKELANTSSDADVPPELLRYLVTSFKQIVERSTGAPFPQDPTQQLRGAIEDRKSTRLNSSHYSRSRMPSSA